MGCSPCKSRVEPLEEAGVLKGKKKEELLAYINRNVIGKDAVFTGTFGRRKAVYCDYTASGRPLKFIEDFIHHRVYPFYANTHTTTSITGLQTSRFRREAREIIRKCVNASEEDVVIFCGSGVTGCVHKLMHALAMKGDKAKQTAVIVGPFEHHSNILPWRESGATVDRVKETFHGLVDLEDLEAKLKKYKAEGKELIVSMSACSNVTGIKTDTEEVARLTHTYGALSVWDYATGAPYLRIDMNPSKLGYKDCIMISPHKFVGGPGTPGVMIAKKHIFKNSIPGGCGGGTVTFVTTTTHQYVRDIEEREEGGTPAIVESIRAGLTFQLKQAIGAECIEKKEDTLCRRAIKCWRQNPNIVILGSKTTGRLPIFSLLVKHRDSGKLIHHNFIATLLNDLYGVQARSGCACAGPYAQDLLSMDEEQALKFAWFLQKDQSEGCVEITNDKTHGGPGLEIMKPGFTRLNLPFFFDEETVDYVIHAVDMVATHGWKLLPMFGFNAETAEWYHTGSPGGPTVGSLYDINYESGKFKIGDWSNLSERGNVNLTKVAAEAKIIFQRAELDAKKVETEGTNLHLPDDQDKYIWFMQPLQSLMYLKTPSLRHIASNFRPVPFSARKNTWVRANRAWRRLAAKAMEQKVVDDLLNDMDNVSSEGKGYEEGSQKANENVIHYGVDPRVMWSPEYKKEDSMMGRHTPKSQKEVSSAKGNRVADVTFTRAHAQTKTCTIL